MAVGARVIRDLQPETAASADLLRVALAVKRGRPVAAAIRAVAALSREEPSALEQRLCGDLGLVALLAPRR